MSPAFTRVRAERFDALVSSGQSSETYAELLSLVGALRDVTPVEPRAEFAASLREQLMAAAPAAMATAVRDHAVPRKTAPRRQHERRISVAIGAVAIVGATTASAIASNNALPGDTLYPIKRAIETIQTEVTVGDQAKGATVLAQAGDRLDEVQKLQAKGADSSDLKQALKAYADQAAQASQLLLGDFRQHGDAASIAQLQAFTDEGMRTLSSLVGVLPPSLESALANATQTLLDIVHEASQACPSCNLGVLEIPSPLVNLVSGGVSGGAANATQSSTNTAPRGPITQTTDPTIPSTSASSGSTTQKPADKPTSKPSVKLPSVGTGLGNGKNTLPTLPSGVPTSLGQAVTGLTSPVGGTVSGLGSAIPGPLGGTVDGLGQTVDGLGNTVNGILGQ